MKISARKENLGFLEKKKRRKRRKKSVGESSLEASLLYTGRDINEIPKIPLVQFTGYYNLTQNANMSMGQNDPFIIPWVK